MHPPPMGYFPFYLPVSRHFFHSRDETSCYSRENADGRIFLKCCQCTMMNRLLAVDYMSNYRVDCMHPVITYRIRRTERYGVHRNRKKPNEATKIYIYIFFSFVNERQIFLSIVWVSGCKILLFTNIIRRILNNICKNYILIYIYALS